MLVGDVHPNVEEVAGAVTPVPGGVGPLTITMLMKNTLVAAQARQSRAAWALGRASSAAWTATICASVSA